MSEYALRFDNAEVEGELAMHIEEQHSLRMSTENASLAVHLLEGALDRRSARRNKARHAGLSSTEALTCEDFGIHETPPEKLAAEKQAIEQEIENARWDEVRQTVLREDKSQSRVLPKDRK
jgi:hypothetical protein